MQHIDTRCLNAGEDFVVAGSFKLLNSTGHGASCFDTGEDIENDPEKCPTVRMIGRNCDNDDVDFQIQNELGIVQGWEPENFNDFNTRITISQDLSTCQEVVIMAGYKITTEKDILSKSMNMIPATASPTNSPTVPGTASPTGSPTFKPTGPTFAPTLRPTMVATPLPPVGETSTIGDGVVSVALSAANTLTTLSRVNVDEEGIESSVVPIARSYNSNDWEKAAGRIVRNTMFDDSWWCHDSACENNLPMLGDGQLYKLTTTTASLRSLEGKSECARFFESATFGTSTEDLKACMNPSGSATPTMTPTTSSPTISAMPTRADLGPGASIETWTNVGGTTLNAIDWNSQPNQNDVISGEVDAVLEGPVNTAENYAERIRTYLVPPVTGSYTFWIASDDQGSLLLSSDSDPANAIEIASVPYWANPREYGKYPEQRSDAISLVAGEVYYLEAKMKEGGGGDNLSVAWEYPGQSQQVIPASYGRIPIPQWSESPTMAPTSMAPTTMAPTTTTAMPTSLDLGTGASIETWTNVGGTTLNAIDWNSQPNQNDVISGDGDAVLEGPVNTAENYAERIRTYLVPPVTGSYTFWIASDDQGSLLLSSDSDPANAIEIASVPYWANPREYGKYPEQRSDAISLVAGEVYFLEAKMKEGGGGDNLSVAWEYPGQSQQVIPASYGRINPPANNESRRLAVADNTIITDSIIPWLQTQMDPDDTPMTSHREFFRSRANSVWPSPEAIGRGGKPCSAGSRWRQRAFSPMEVNDRFNPYKLNIVPIQSYCHNPNASATHHVLFLDGYPRTAVEGLDLSQFVSSPEEVGWHLDFEICHLYPLHIRVFQEFPNQNPCIRVFHENPIVDFPESMCHIGQNIDLSSANTSPVGDNDILLQDDLSDDLCETLPETASKLDPPIFGQLSDGSHVIFDARLILLDNTAESPALDGGGEVSLETNEITLCSSAPRTFLNEDTCVLSTDPSACAIDKSVEALIPLNEENILQLHDLTGRYTYAIQGLVVVDNMANEVLHSCTPGYRSRWEKEANQQCENPTNIDVMTNQTLTDLIIANEGDPNPTLRDITFPDSGAMCDLSTGVGIKIQVGIDCWTQVHHDHLGVYDVTYWT